MMKKTIIGLTLLSWLSAFAEIPRGCKEQMDDLASARKSFEAIVPTMLSNGTAEHLIRSIRNALHIATFEEVRTACVSLRINQIPAHLEDTSSGQPNLIRILVASEAEAKKTYDELTRYYEEKIKADN